MVGKGWIWFISDSAASLPLPGIAKIKEALNGLIGISPKGGEGSLYLKFLSQWLEKRNLEYPGVVHTSQVQYTEKSNQFYF